MSRKPTKSDKISAIKMGLKIYSPRRKYNFRTLLKGNRKVSFSFLLATIFNLGYHPKLFCRFGNTVFSERCFNLFVNESLHKKRCLYYTCLVLIMYIYNSVLWWTL